MIMWKMQKKNCWMTKSSDHEERGMNYVPVYLGYGNRRLATSQ